MFFFLSLLFEWQSFSSEVALCCSDLPWINTGKKYRRLITIYLLTAVCGNSLNNKIQCARKIHFSCAFIISPFSVMACVAVLQLGLGRAGDRPSEK